MSVVWRKQAGGQQYEVRQAGSSVRLYTDGVFHSQYNPGHVVGGNLWDLMWLPAFFLPDEQPKRCLLLGVGGGSVMRQLNRFFPKSKLIGVDIDSDHLYVAKRFFGVKGESYELHHANAIDWVSGYQDLKFDYILEDLYGEEGGEPRRAVLPDVQWVETLLSHLAPGGVLAFNFTTLKDFKTCAWHESNKIKKQLPSAFRLSHSAYENRIMVMCREKADVRQFRSRLMADPVLSKGQYQGRLNYHIRQI